MTRAPSRLSRKEHERRFEDLAKLGEQRGMPAADILPPLPWPPDVVAAHASLLPRRHGPDYDRWAETALGQVDPRAPWKRDPWATGLAQDIGRRRLVLIEPYAGLDPNERAGKGCKATLFATRADDSVTAHTLVRAKSGRPVMFDDRSQAQEKLRAVVMAGGNLPSRWEWGPPADDPGPRWKPDGDSGARLGRWWVLDGPNGPHVLHNGKYILDRNGNPRNFQTPPDARRFCEENRDQ